MSQAAPRPDPLKRPAMAIAGFLAVCVLLALFGRQERVQMPPAPEETKASVALRFVDRQDGSVVAVDAATGEEIERIAPGQGGFVRVTMRSFARERMQRGIGNETPFTLTRRNDGSLVLSDAATGRVMLLDAFGPSNEGVFATLIDNNQ